MKSFKSHMPDFLSSAFAMTGGDEALAVSEWKSRLTPDEVLIFEVRRRDTQDPVPVEQVDPKDFEKLEVLFKRMPGSSEPVLWKPGSEDALLKLLQGS